MELIDTLGLDIVMEAKGGNYFAVSVIRVLKSKLQACEISLRGIRYMNKDDEFKVVMKEIKEREEAVEMYKKANRPEKAQEELDAIAIVRRYLPVLVGEDVLKPMVDKIVIDLGERASKNMIYRMVNSRGLFFDSAVLNKVIDDKLKSLQK